MFLCLCLCVFMFCWVAIDLIDKTGCSSFFKFVCIFCVCVHVFLCSFLFCCRVAIDFIYNNGCNSCLQFVCVCVSLSLVVFYISVSFVFVLLFFMCMFVVCVPSLFMFSWVAIDCINNHGCDALCLSLCLFVVAGFF